MVKPDRLGGCKTQPTLGTSMDILGKFISALKEQEMDLRCQIMMEVLDSVQLVAGRAWERSVFIGHRCICELMVWKIGRRQALHLYQRKDPTNNGEARLEQIPSAKINEDRVLEAQAAL